MPGGKSPAGRFFCRHRGFEKKSLTWSALQGAGWKRDENRGALRALRKRRKRNGEKDTGPVGQPAPGRQLGYFVRRVHTGCRRGGHRCEKVFLRDQTIGYCTGCGVWEKGEVKGTAHMQAAYRMGKNA